MQFAVYSIFISLNLVMICASPTLGWTNGQVPTLITIMNLDGTNSYHSLVRFVVNLVYSNETDNRVIIGLLK